MSSDTAKCPLCKRDFLSSMSVCPYCNVSLNREGGDQKGSPEWVNQCTLLLKKTMPKSLLLKAFFPDAEFYAQYYARANKVDGLHYMAGKLFEWLNIKPEGCVISFYNEEDMPSESGKETAGWYTKLKLDGKVTEVIVINSKHINNPLGVGAILAHEMMHLYLRRKNVEFEETLENELLTDLATIYAGFGILVLNGMSYSTQWWLTLILIVFGRFYWKSEQLAFGYFNPKEYGMYALNYFHGQNISTSDLFNYLNPSSRHFVPHPLFARSNSPTTFIKNLEKKNFRANLLKVAVVSVVLIFGFVSGSGETAKNSELSSQIDKCKNEGSTLETLVKNDQDALEDMKTKIDNYENIGDTNNFNNLVDPYNALLSKVQNEYSQYDSKIDECNALVEQYNKQ